MSCLQRKGPGQKGRKAGAIRSGELAKARGQARAIFEQAGRPEKGRASGPYCFALLRRQLQAASP